MLNTRKFQTLGITLLIVAVALVTLSAIRLPAPKPENLSWPPRPDFSFLVEKATIPVTGNEAGLAQYHSSEWTSDVGIRNGMEVYHQSERDSYKATNGMAIYHQSEWFGK